jgi:hypothetical protein
MFYASSKNRKEAKGMNKQDSQAEQLPIDMHNTIISSTAEKAMVEALTKPKRVRAYKEYYVEQCALLKQENHALKCRAEQLGKDCEKLKEVQVAIVGSAKHQIEELRADNRKLHDEAYKQDDEVGFSSCLVAFLLGMAIGIATGLFGKAVSK